jgi:hypothetical protein
MITLIRRTIIFELSLPWVFPQGGIDSPYLFNIVFFELNKYIEKDIQSYLDGLNKKVGFCNTKNYTSPMIKKK